MDSSLYSPGPHINAQAPLLIHCLHGAIDAGATCRLAMIQMHDATMVGRVATFNPDEFTDYRSSRPVATIKDWTLTQVETSQITLDLAADLEGKPFLILHGPEPDFRWEAFAEQVRLFALRAGVRKAISLLAVPAAVPHTRPTRVHLTTTDIAADEDVLPQSSLLNVATSASMFLQERLARVKEFESYGLVASVPYYLPETEFFPAATEMIQAISKLGELSLPVGDLQAATHQLQAEIASSMTDDEEVSSLIGMLEERFDSVVESGDGAIKTASLSFEDTAIPSADEIGRSLESFLHFEQARQDKSQNKAEKSRFPRRPRHDPRIVDSEASNERTRPPSDQPSSGKSNDTDSTDSGA